MSINVLSKAELETSEGLDGVGTVADCTLGTEAVGPVNAELIEAAPD
jgi:hypothetical protein